MLPVACATTHGRTHALMNVSVTCNRTPTRPDGLLHGWSACNATHGSLHVDQHASFACNATSRASACQAACAASMYGNTSSF
ncbi:hypothetical protein F2Q69_00022325 [Brassica cretica]|uniref:Uncharacterized protein n=1 Tax=Brassica cretica TaxID=69181 RepID=A0A8S9Q6Q1_BRACR|nr:hypothetical protein F2Q69_00022325 [Brassica cretica]